jgi:hypothetical protein
MAPGLGIVSRDELVLDHCCLDFDKPHTFPMRMRPSDSMQRDPRLILAV